MYNKLNFFALKLNLKIKNIEENIKKTKKHHINNCFK